MNDFILKATKWYGTILWCAIIYKLEVIEFLIEVVSTVF